MADYKKIAKGKNKEKIESDNVSEKEIDDVILNIRKNVAHARIHAKKGLDEHTHNHAEISEEHLPEMNNDFLKEIGGELF